MTIIDNLTQMVHLIPTKQTYTVKDIAEVLYEHVYKLHGTPEIIISDRDSLFTSDFWTRLSELTKTELKMSSAYHPQTDGMTKRMHRTYIAILRMCAGKKHDEWSKHLPAIEFAINSARSEATGLAPFYLNYRRIPSPMIFGTDDKFPGVKQHIENIKMAIMTAHDVLIDARVKMTKQANGHRKPAKFEAGELVYVSTKNMRVPKGLSKKLANRYVGPYLIKRVITEGATYELELGKDLRARGIHPVFHASLLRPHTPVDDVRFPGRDFKQIASLGGEPEEWAVERILSHTGKGRNADFEILWKSGDRTWEPYRIVRHLKALENYCEAKGVKNVSKLTDLANSDESVKTEIQVHSISICTGYKEGERPDRNPPTPPVVSKQTLAPYTMSDSDVRLSKDALEVLLNSQNRSQTESNNALIRSIEVAASILERAGGKETSRKRKAKYRGPYQKPHQQQPENPGRRKQQRNKNKRNANAPNPNHTDTAASQSTTQTTPPSQQTALVANPIGPITDAEMLDLGNLEQIFNIPQVTTETPNAPEETPVPAYTPQPTHPTQNTTTEGPIANQTQTSTHIGAFPTSQTEETVDYEEDYTMDEHTAH